MENPYQDLLEQAIAAASAHLQEEGVGKVSLNKIYEELADFISETIPGYSITAKTIRNYKDAFSDNPGFTIPQALATEGLCKYLGYPDYKTWLIAQETLDPKPPTEPEGKRNRLLLWFVVFIGVLTVGWGIHSYVNRDRWMIWEDDQYVEVAFDETLYSQGMLKVYDERLIEKFFKKHPDSIKAFFDLNQKAIIYYGKNANGQLEYFTLLDVHPETGKSLKPITQYMINTHILPNRLEKLNAQPVD